MVVAIFERVYLLEKKTMYRYIETCLNFNDTIFEIFLKLIIIIIIINIYSLKIYFKSRSYR